MSDKTNIDEQIRIKRILDGRREEYSYFVNQYSQAIIDFTYRMVEDLADAEDLAQEAFVKAYRLLSSFRGQSLFYTWLRRIAYHESLNHLKHRTIHWMNIDDITYSDEKTLEDELSTGKEERIILMEEALSDLSPEEQMLIHLYYYEDLSLREIAFIMDVEPNVLATRLHRIRKKLLIMIKQKENE